MLSNSSAAQWLASDAAAIEIDRERCRRSLVTFIRRAWHVLEPMMPLTMGWAIEAMCEHLEAVSNGELNRLVINVPPGMMKSLMTSVFWPAWEWGPLGRPETRIMGASYEEELAIRDTRKMRMLVESDWYQERWPVRLASDQNQKTKFENVSTGFRLARPSKSLTGERVNRLIIDDPHSVNTAESELVREGVLLSFREAAQNRMVDPLRSAIVVIMQRLHELDVSGWVIENASNVYETLVLPMEFEADRRCTTRIGFTDPRTYDGELLFPERFPKEALDRDRPILGEYAWAGQYQQRPAPREGGLFKADRIKPVEALPKCTHWVRAWDLAGTEGAGAYTAGVLMGKHAGGYVIADVRRKQLSPGGVRDLIKTTAAEDVKAFGKEVRIRLPQDPGQAGKAQALDMRKDLDGYIVRIELPTGEKEIRAMPYAVQVEGERVTMLKADWNEPYIAELRVFPAGRYLDQVDASADAHNELVKIGGNQTQAFPAVGVSRPSPFLGAVRGG